MVEFRIKFAATLVLKNYSKITEGAQYAEGRLKKLQKISLLNIPLRKRVSGTLKSFLIGFQNLYLISIISVILIPKIVFVVFFTIFQKSAQKFLEICNMLRNLQVKILKILQTVTCHV